MIPKEARQVLDKWRQEVLPSIEKDSIKKVNRIPYYYDDIDLAFDEFEETYGCNWQLMKRKEKDEDIDYPNSSNIAQMNWETGDDQAHLKTLQIINDLRSAYLTTIFEKLKHEYPELDILDFGSQKLTSDRDFAFALGSHLQAKEAQIVEKYHKLFKELWGNHAVSATVFDSNAYTMQYLLRASTPEVEKMRSQQQTEGSLLMKLRNSTPDSWKAFKEETLKEMGRIAGNPELNEDEVEHIKRILQSQISEFEKIEHRNQVLEKLLNEEILLQLTSEDSQKAFKELKAEFVKQNLDSTDSFQEALRKIKQIRPAVVEKVLIDASDKLHQKIKKGFAEQETFRHQFQKEMEALLEENDPIKFIEIFNQTVDQALANIDHHNDINVVKTLRRIEQIRAEDYLKNPSAFKEAFYARKAFQKKFELAHQKKMEQESLQMQFGKMRAQLEKLQDGSERILLSRDCEILAKRLDELGDLNLVLQEYQEKQVQLKELHGEFWTKTQVEYLVSDLFLYLIQQANIQGMCFAQEAHVSEGAFAFVVLNLQAKKSNVLTLGQTMHAIREISGFQSGHQKDNLSSNLKEANNHPETISAARMVEISKYAQRLFLAFDFIKDRSLALKIYPPNFVIERGNELMELKNFFLALSSLRGIGLSEEGILKKTEEFAEKYEIFDVKKGDRFGPTHVELINNYFEKLVSHVEVWYKLLPEEQQEAFYKI